MIVDQWFLYAIAAGVTLLIGIVGLIGYLVYKKHNKNASYNSQLQELIDDNVESGGGTVITLSGRWNSYWSKLFKESGLARYNDENNKAGRDVLFFIIIVVVVLGVIFRSFFIGPIVAAVSIVIFVNLVRFKNQREQNKISSQLPGFLAALKSNIQANTTPEKAILKIVDDMPSPLYEDLYPAKQQLQVNTPFKVVIDDLSMRTKSKDLKFLCACLLQATSSGANLEGQIGTIQDVLAERQKINDELSKAVSSVTPSIYVASFTIPAMFIFLYITNSPTRDFWFKSILSWIVFAAVLLLWGMGIWIAKKQVDKIRNL